MAEEKKNIKFGQIGNALRSAASDHVTAVASDIFDEDSQKYQNAINAELDTSIKSEAQARTENDERLSSAISEERDRAKAAEEANATSIIGTDRIADGAVTIEKLADSAIDDESTAGSDNLVKSGGVYKIQKYFIKNDSLRNREIGVGDFYMKALHYSDTGNFDTASSRRLTDIITVYQNESFLININNYENTLSVIALDENYNVLLSKCISGNQINVTYTVDDASIKYLRFGANDLGLRNVKRVLSDNEKKENNQKLFFNNTPALGNNYLVNGAGVYSFVEKEKTLTDLNKVDVKNGVNLLNPQDVVDGYLNSQGNFDSSSTYKCSGFIPVEEETSYIFTGGLGSEGTFNFFYDSELNIIGSPVAGDYGFSHVFTTPANCAYMKISMIGSSYSEDATMFCKGTNAPNFEPFNPISGYIKKTQEKQYGPDVYNFRNWDVMNNSWSISANGKQATSLLTGYQNNMFYNNFGHSCEDDFNLSAEITPLTGDSNGYFEVAIGKFQSLSGTMISVGKDAEGDFYAIYSVNANGVPQLFNKYHFSGIEFGINKKSYVLIKKRTITDGHFYISITDKSGLVVEGIDLHPSTYAWGEITAYVITGTAMIENVQFGYPLDINNIKVIVWGHSFVEGNAISGKKDKRWCAKLRADLGEKETAILGLGGARIVDLEKHYMKELKWLSTSRYAILMYGTNDEDSATTTGKMQIINDNLIAAGIKPIWTTVAPLLDGGQVKPTIEAYIEAHFDYIDIRPAFYTNGELDPNMFLEDRIHPSISCNERLYQIFKSQMNYLYTL